MRTSTILAYTLVCVFHVAIGQLIQTSRRPCCKNTDNAKRIVMGNRNVEGMSKDVADEHHVIGYYTSWSIYRTVYENGIESILSLKRLKQSNSDSKLTHLVYAFGTITEDGKCDIYDAWADYQRPFEAHESVDGQPDPNGANDGVLRGNFNQLRKLKSENPNLKVLYSFGGWTLSKYFSVAASSSTKMEEFAQSCFDLVKDSRWADVFDGIDIDWEYPNACQNEGETCTSPAGPSCDCSGPDAYSNLIIAVRQKFGDGLLVTSAIASDGSEGGKIDSTNYFKAQDYLDFYMVMTYDYFGAFSLEDGTALHAPLYSYDGIPKKDFYAAKAIDKLKESGIRSSKLLLGIPSYGRGWIVQDGTPLGGPVIAASHGTVECGIEDYRWLKENCDATQYEEDAKTAYAQCWDSCRAPIWYGFDTPTSISWKAEYASQQGLRGLFTWELMGDTSDGEIVSAMKDGVDMMQMSFLRRKVQQQAKCAAL